jgi:hypothetical protein
MSGTESTHEIAETTKSDGPRRDPSAPAESPHPDVTLTEEGQTDAPKQVMPDGR